MGKIAEALRANLQSIAQSDARSLRELDQELFNAKAAARSTPTYPSRCTPTGAAGSWSAWAA